MLTPGRRFVVQLQQGCGNPRCTTPMCYTCKARVCPHQTRRYTTVTARAMAVELAISPNWNKYLCPHMSRVAETASCSIEDQQKTDPKSVVQQLFNTHAFRNFLATDNSQLRSLDTSSTKKMPTLLHEFDRLTCDEMIKTKSALAEERHQLRMRTFSTDRVYPLHFDDIARTPAVRRLLTDLSSFRGIVESFDGSSLQIWEKSKGDDLPATCLDQAFRGWSSGMQILIFDSIWLALVPSDVPTTEPQSTQEPKICHESLTPQTDNNVTTAVSVAIHALTASIPRAQRDTWHVVWSTIVNGRAYGKQRFRKSDIFSSPWLHMLDAFESEPGLRLVQRSAQIIAAHERAEKTAPLPTSDHGSPKQASNIRAALIRLLTDEEEKVRVAKFGAPVRDENHHGKPLLGTTTLLWLEWLRKCFLKSWDGTLRLSRWGVAGMALQLMEDICRVTKYRRL